MDLLVSFYQVQIGLQADLEVGIQFHMKRCNSFLSSTTGGTMQITVEALGFNCKRRICN